MMVARVTSVVFFVFLLSPCCYCYYHVVVMHGIFASNASMVSLVNMIAKAHPGTKITDIDGFDDAVSLLNMWIQNEAIYEKMKSIITGDDPVILIGFSQGSILCRSILEKYNHNVHTFISLSGPLAGQYGDTSYLKYLFPNFFKSTLYRFFYTVEGQQLSIADYWNDPFHQEEYFKSSVFLAGLNNGAVKGYKENFSKLKQLVLIGGPDDGVITPWESSQFGFYKDNSADKVISYKSQYYYKEDTFGLKTLDDNKAIVTHTVSGVHHTKWHVNQTVFDCCIEPYLI